MGIQDVIAITIALGAVAFTIRFVRKTLKGEEGCSSCPTASAKKLETPQLKRTPLVTLETSKAARAK